MHSNLSCGPLGFRQQRQRIMTLETTEFIRRFLLHVLPKGFMRIRHYGFLANRCRKQQLARCRQLLGQATSTETSLGRLETVATKKAEALHPCLWQGRARPAEGFRKKSLEKQAPILDCPSIPLYSRPAD